MEPLTPETDDSTAASMSYVLREEEQLAQVWSDADRAEHDRSVREGIERTGGIRQLVGGLRARSDSIWERFVTLTLERLLSEQLREFLDQIDACLLYTSVHHHPIIEGAVPGGHPLDRDPFRAGRPGGGDAGPDHQSLIGFAFVNEQAARRPDEIGTDPGVRHVADEARRLGIVPDHFGPMIPGRRPLALQKECQRFLRLVAKPQPD